MQSFSAHFNSRKKILTFLTVLHLIEYSVFDPGAIVHDST